MEDDTAKIKSINFSQILLADPGPSLLHRCAAKIFPCRCSEISTFTILTLAYNMNLNSDPEQNYIYRDMVNKRQETIKIINKTN